MFVRFLCWLCCTSMVFSHQYYVLCKIIRSMMHTVCGNVTCVHGYQFVLKLYTAFLCVHIIQHVYNAECITHNSEQRQTYIHVCIHSLCQISLEFLIIRGSIEGAQHMYSIYICFLELQLLGYNSRVNTTAPRLYFVIQFRPPWSIAVLYVHVN